MDIFRAKIFDLGIDFPLPVSSGTLDGGGSRRCPVEESDEIQEENGIHPNSHSLSLEEILIYSNANDLGSLARMFFYSGKRAAINAEIISDYIVFSNSIKPVLSLIANQRYSAYVVHQLLLQAPYSKSYRRTGFKWFAAYTTLVDYKPLPLKAYREFYESRTSAYSTLPQLYAPRLMSFREGAIHTAWRDTKLDGIEFSGAITSPYQPYAISKTIQLPNSVEIMQPEIKIDYLPRFQISQLNYTPEQEKTDEFAKDYLKCLTLDVLSEALRFYPKLKILTTSEEGGYQPTEFKNNPINYVEAKTFNELVAAGFNNLQYQMPIITISDPFVRGYFVNVNIELLKQENNHKRDIEYKTQYLPHIGFFKGEVANGERNTTDKRQLQLKYADSKENKEKKTMPNDDYSLHNSYFEIKEQNKSSLESKLNGETAIEKSEIEGLPQNVAVLRSIKYGGIGDKILNQNSEVKDLYEILMPKERQSLLKKNAFSDEYKVNSLEAIIHNLKQELGPKQFGFVVYRKSTGEYFEENGEGIVPTPSMNKLAIGFTLLYYAQHGLIDLNRKIPIKRNLVLKREIQDYEEFGKKGANVSVQELFFHMMTRSVNTASNHLIDLIGDGYINLGMNRVNKFMDYLGFPAIQINDIYNKKRKYNSNAGSAATYASFMDFIINSDLLRQKYSKMLKEALDKEEHSKIYKSIFKDMPTWIKPTTTEYGTGLVINIDNDISLAVTMYGFDKPLYTQIERDYGQGPKIRNHATPHGSKAVTELYNLLSEIYKIMYEPQSNNLKKVA